MLPLVAGFKKFVSFAAHRSTFPPSSTGGLETCMKTWSVTIIRRWTMDLLFKMEMYAVSAVFYETKFWHFPFFFLSSKSGFVQFIAIVSPSRIGERPLTLLWHRSREEGSHLICIFLLALLFAATKKQCLPPPSFPFPPYLGPSSNYAQSKGLNRKQPGLVCASAVIKRGSKKGINDLIEE